MEKFFPKGYFELKFGPDMSGTWFDLIELNIWIDEKTFFYGASGHINYIDQKFLPLRRKLNLLGEV